MYILMAKRDGHIVYGSEPHMGSKNRLLIDFFPASSRLHEPYKYNTRDEVEDNFRKWQQSFPASSDGWMLIVQEDEP